MQEQESASSQGRPEEITDQEQLQRNAEEAGAESEDRSQNQRDDEKPGNVSGVQKLKARLERARQEAELWKEEAFKARNNGKPAEARQEAEPEDKPPVKPVKPKMADFPATNEGYQQYESALEKFDDAKDKYYEDTLSFQLRKAEQNRQQKAETQGIADGWADQVAKAEEKYPDFKEIAFNKDLPLSEAMMHAIVSSELGTEVAYELGKNPDEAERIAKLGPVAAIREIGKIESRIASKQSAAPTEDDKEEPEPPAATTRAPKPPVPVRRTSAASNSEPDDKDDYKTWLKKREAQLQK